MRRTRRLWELAAPAVVALGVATLASSSWHGAAQQASAVPMEVAATGFRVEFSILEKEPTLWEGEVSVTGGSVLRVDLWEPGANGRVEGARFSVRAGGFVKKKKGGLPQLFATVRAPADAEVELKTNRGTARFRLSALQAAQSTPILEGAARVWKAAPAFRLTGQGRDEGFPAAATAPDGTVWVAYTSYQPGAPLDQKAIEARDFGTLGPRGNGDSVFVMSYDGKNWSAPIEATEQLGDLWRPAVAVDGRGQVWVFWSEQREGNWDLYQRRWDPKAKQWTRLERLTSDPGADVNVVAARDAKGNVWWAWQAWRGDNFDILAASSGQTGAPPATVADTPANEWSPSICADPAGNVWAAWDGYTSGSYDVFARRLNPPGDTVAVTATAYYEARPSIACDGSGRVWVAYEEDAVNWGKDYANANRNRPVDNLGAPLYLNRRVRVKVLAGDQRLAPPQDPREALGELRQRPASLPRLAVDGGGNVWLLVRHHARFTRAGEVWSSSAMRFDGRRWAPAEPLAASDNLLDVRPALAAFGREALLAIYPSDGRMRAEPGPREDNLFAAILTAPAAQPVRLVPDVVPQPDAPVIHPSEQDDIARVRAYRIEAGGKTYRLLRGEFHRHTEYTSHGDGDGGLEEMWRYGLDGAAMEWIGNGDHDNGYGREYAWWVIQKVTDIYHHPPHFVPPFTYERSVVYPNGHRNVMFARRGVRPLPRGGLPGTAEEGAPDTKLLYAYLRHFGGICSVHTSATNMGTDWRDNDPEVEPVVEIYQGHRHNYEHSGAPRSATLETQLGGYQPAGFVWNAWARGYRLGVQSSSDHISTHMSYAVAIAETASREGLLDAFRKRHTYGATDNIILDVRAGEHLMGDEFTLSEPVRLHVRAIGTGPIRRVFIIKNNGYVYETAPRSQQVDFTWEDVNVPGEGRQAPSSLHYYYVRLEQEDGQLAWSSPIWVRYQ